MGADGCSLRGHHAPPRSGAPKPGGTGHVTDDVNRAPDGHGPDLGWVVSGGGDGGCWSEGERGQSGREDRGQCRCGSSGSRGMLCLQVVDRPHSGRRLAMTSPTERKVSAKPAIRLPRPNHFVTRGREPVRSMSQLRTRHPHRSGVVIIGGGLAGQRCAETLRRNGYDAPIRMVCAEPHRPYDRPPLSKQLLAGAASGDPPAYRPAEWYRRESIELLLRVSASDRAPSS